MDGPHAPMYETFITHYAPSCPLPELAVSLSVQPSGPKPQSPRDMDRWFNETVIRLMLARQSCKNDYWS
jgi:hypothetical protein